MFFSPHVLTSPTPCRTCLENFPGVRSEANMEETLSEMKEQIAGAKKDARAWIAGFKEHLDQRTVHGPLGIEVISVSDEGVILECDITDAVRQPMGLLHGGVSVLIAESAASLHAAWCADLTKVAPVGVDINGTHLRSATEGRVRATTHTLRQTRTFIFHEVNIEHVETGELLCKVRISNFFKPIG